jgi:hypothetical protein
MSYIVVVYDGDYPDGPGSSCSLLGSYISRNAARYISEAYKRRNKLDFYPRIMEADVPPDLPEAEILEENLRLIELKEKNEKRKQNKYKTAELQSEND